MATKRFCITCEHPYAPWDTIYVEAKDLQSARKKAKAIYAKRYFTPGRIKTYNEPSCL